MILALRSLWARESLTMKTSTYNSITTTLYIILGIVIPTALTLSMVKIPATIIQNSPNPTHLGYTVSLSLFIFPMLALIWWFRRQSKLKLQQQAFWITVVLLVPSGVILDILFGNAFFSFVNHNAVIG